MGAARSTWSGSSGFGVCSLLCGIAPNTELLVRLVAFRGSWALLARLGRLPSCSPLFDRADRVGHWCLVRLGGIAAAIGRVVGGPCCQRGRAASLSYQRAGGDPLHLEARNYVPESRDEQMTGPRTSSSRLSRDWSGWSDSGPGRCARTRYRRPIVLVVPSFCGVVCLTSLLLQPATDPLVPPLDFPGPHFHTGERVDRLVYTALVGVRCVRPAVQVSRRYSPTASGVAGLPPHHLLRLPYSGSSLRDVPRLISSSVVRDPLWACCCTCHRARVPRT